MWSIIVLAVAEGGNVTLRFQRGYSRDANRKTVPSVPWAQDDISDFIEGLARWGLGNACSAKYDRTTVSLQSRSWPGLRSPLTKRLHIDARGWAVSRGYGYRLNIETGRAVIDRPSGDIVLPVGSPKVKVGAAWVEIGDCVVAVEDQVFVPVEVIQNL